MVEIVSDKLRCKCGHVRAHHSASACWADMDCGCHGFTSRATGVKEATGIGFTVLGRKVGLVDPREWHLKKQNTWATINGHRMRGWAFGPLVVLQRTTHER